MMSRKEPRKLEGSGVTSVEEPAWEKCNIFSSSAASREFAPEMLYTSHPGTFTSACLSAKALASCCTHGHM